MATKTYPVKWIDSTMRGAPRLSGTAGDLINVLDALLITGWGAITPTSITVASGVATVVTSVGDSFVQDAVVLISGATPAALNGEQRVLTSSNTGFTFATSAASGSATGTISIKYAPQGGWEKVFSGTNKAVYRSLDALGARYFYRFDDSSASGRNARLVGYADMTDVDTGSAPFPTGAQMSEGLYYPKANANNTNAVPYVFAADGRLVITASNSIESSSFTRIYVVRGFGDLVPLQATDVSCAVVSGTTAEASVERADRSFGHSNTGYNNARIFLPRALGGSLTPVDAVAYPAGGGYSNASGDDATMGGVAALGRLLLCSRVVFDNGVARAKIPGVYHCPQSGLAALAASGDAIVPDGALPGRVLSVIGVKGTNSVGNMVSGLALLDIIGPWR